MYSSQDVIQLSFSRQVDIFSKKLPLDKFVLLSIHSITCCQKSSLFRFLTNYILTNNSFVLDKYFED